MLETLTVITLLTLFMLFFRPGKTEPLKSPLVINRNGQFHAVLAPMLNLAQPLLEDISGNFGEPDRKNGDSRTRYYKVTDKEVRAHGKDHYLLAVSLHGGELYFQAASPQDGNSEIETLRAFSNPILARHPAVAAHSEAAEAALTLAIETAAAKHGATLALLTQ